MAECECFWNFNNAKLICAKQSLSTSITLTRSLTHRDHLPRDVAHTKPSDCAVIIRIRIVSIMSNTTSIICIFFSRSHLLWLLFFGFVPFHIRISSIRIHWVGFKVMCSRIFDSNQNANLHTNWIQFKHIPFREEEEKKNREKTINSYSIHIERVARQKNKERHKQTEAQSQCSVSV